MAIGEGGVKKRLDVTWRECVKSNNLLNIYFIFRRKVHTCLFYTRIKLMQKKETMSFKYQIIQFLHWENIEGKHETYCFSQINKIEKQGGVKKHIQTSMVKFKL